MTKLKTQSLHKRDSDLANSNRQLEILSNGIFQNGELPKFKEKISETAQFPLKAKNSKFYKSMLVICVTKFVSIVMLMLVQTERRS